MSNIINWVKTYLYRIIFIAAAAIIMSLVIDIVYLNIELNSKETEIKELITSKRSIKEELRQARDQIENAVFVSRNECSKKNADVRIKEQLNQETINILLKAGKYKI
jgi:folate-dependent phosphoribosylglycinamide formyltransferase PurN